MDEITRGKLIAFEGIDGSGKSTQLKLLADRLRERGIRCFETREPTDSFIGVLLRQILTGQISAHSKVVASLFLADRAEHLLNEKDGLCRKIDEGITVLTDRYYFSSYAYHGVDMNMEWVIQANSIHSELLRPAVTVFLDISPETAMDRISKNRTHTELYEKEERLRRVREKYFEAFERLKEEENVAVIDAFGTAEEVAERVWQAVEGRL